MGRVYPLVSGFLWVYHHLLRGHLEAAIELREAISQVSRLPRLPVPLGGVAEALAPGGWGHFCLRHLWPKSLLTAGFAGVAVFLIPVLMLK